VTQSALVAIVLGVGVPTVVVFGWAAWCELRRGNRRAVAWAAFGAGLFEAFIEVWPAAFALWALAVAEALLSRRAR
jgi:hypothetical protein